MRLLSPSEFLSYVWPKKLLTHETLELRCLRREDNRLHREFCTSIDDFLEKASAYKDWEVYFSLATRFGQDGTKVGCYRIATLWCDLDGKTFSDCEFSIQPDILVNSGGGVHAYWLLHNPVLVRGERWVPIENRARWLAREFGGDINTTDVSRILRVPAYFNHKYNPAREVRAYAV